MVFQVLAKHTTQYLVPKGETVAAFKVDDGTVIEAGSISDHIVELDMRESKPLFKKGSLPAGLESLYVSDLVEGSYYPPTLKKLFIRDYSGNQPFPVSLDIFLHPFSIHEVKGVYRHHIFVYGASDDIWIAERPEYERGPIVVMGVFDTQLTTAVCIPRDSTPVETRSVAFTASGPIPLIETPLPTVSTDNKTKLIQAQFEFIEMQKKLVQTQQQVADEQLKVLRTTRS